LVKWKIGPIMIGGVATVAVAGLRLVKMIGEGVEVTMIDGLFFSQFNMTI